MARATGGGGGGVVGGAVGWDFAAVRRMVVKGGRFPGGMITFMLVIGSRARWPEAWFRAFS